MEKISFEDYVVVYPDIVTGKYFSISAINFPYLLLFFGAARYGSSLLLIWNTNFSIKFNVVKKSIKSALEIRCLFYII